MRHRRGVGRLRLRLVAALVEAVDQEKQKRIERSRHVAKLSDLPECPSDPRLTGVPLRPPQTMDKFAFQEHVLDAQWVSIHGPATNTIDEPFFLNNKVAQHVKKMKFFRALFRGDLEPTLQVDFSHPSANGEERESRLRRWAEELWKIVNENSMGTIFDRVTKRSHDVIDEICEHHGGHSSNYCTRFGWFNTFRAPGPARQGICLQDEEFGQPFLDI